MKDVPSGARITVLLVDDSPGDVRLTRDAFAEANSLVDLQVAYDGVEAMTYLNRADGRTRAPRPDLILLDLNMPRLDGREVLAQIKSDPRLRLIPTVILTTSDADVDIARSYHLRANSYLTKPVQLADFERLVRGINDFWLATARLPRQPMLTG